MRSSRKAPLNRALLFLMIGRQRRAPSDALALGLADAVVAAERGRGGPRDRHRRGRGVEPIRASGDRAGCWRPKRSSPATRRSARMADRLPAASRGESPAEFVAQVAAVPGLERCCRTARGAQSERRWRRRSYAQRAARRLMDVAADAGDGSAARRADGAAARFRRGRAGGAGRQGPDAALVAGPLELRCRARRRADPRAPSKLR